MKAQGFLYHHCVSSVVFDYSGHGDSSPPGTVKNVEQDSISAYNYFRSRFKDHAHQCVMGHSMGNGPLLASLLRSRLLVIHSEDDKVNPIAMGPQNLRCCARAEIFRGTPAVQTQ